MEILKLTSDLEPIQVVSLTFFPLDLWTKVWYDDVTDGL